jgi:hypothetical protein
MTRKLKTVQKAGKAPDTAQEVPMSDAPNPLESAAKDANLAGFSESDYQRIANLMLPELMNLSFRGSHPAVERKLKLTIPGTKHTFEVSVPAWLHDALPNDQRLRHFALSEILARAMHADDYKVSNDPSIRRGQQPRVLLDLS